MLKFRNLVWVAIVVFALAMPITANAQFAHRIDPNPRSQALPSPATVRTLALTSAATDDVGHTVRSFHVAIALAGALATLLASLKLCKSRASFRAASALALTAITTIATGLLLTFPLVFAGPTLQSAAINLHLVSAALLTLTVARILVNAPLVNKSLGCQSAPPRAKHAKLFAPTPTC